MMHSAADQFINFINAIRAQGAALFAAKATAYTARTFADDKTNAYRLIVEIAWRKVYMGTEDEGKTTVMGKTVMQKALNCRDIEGVYDHKTHKIANPLLAINPMFCAWMSMGASLPEPSTGWVFSDGKSYQNLKLSLPAVYPELFPPAGVTADTAFETWIAMLGKAPVTDTSNYLGGWTSDAVHGKDINEFEVHGVHVMLSLPPDEIGSSMSQAVDDIAAAAGEVASSAHPATGCEATAAECCGIQEVTLTGTWGLTVMEAINGFCTPNTDPFQVEMARSIKWEIDADKTLAGGAAGGKVSSVQGFCFLGAPAIQPREITVTGVIPLGPSGKMYAYLKLGLIGNWGIASKWAPEKVSVTFSFYTTAIKGTKTSFNLMTIAPLLIKIWAAIKAAIGGVVTPILALKMKDIVKAPLNIIKSLHNVFNDTVTTYCANTGNGETCEQQGAKNKTSGANAIKGLFSFGAKEMLGFGTEFGVNEAGKWVSKLTGGALSFAEDTYTQIDVQATWDVKLKKFSTETGDNSVGISIFKQKGIGFDTANTGLGALMGFDIGVGGYQMYGNSIDLSEVE